MLIQFVRFKIMKLKRIIAFIIDVFASSAIVYITITILRICHIWIIPYIMMVLLYVLMVCKDCYNGQSIGRKIVGIQVFDSKTMKVASPLKCILRNCFYLIYPIEGLVMLCNSLGLRMGDYATQTKVAEWNADLKEVNYIKIAQAIALVFTVFVLLCVFIVMYTKDSEKGLLDLLYNY